MRLLIAFLLPWLTFFTIGRPLTGIFCLVLQITLLGWIPATIWLCMRFRSIRRNRKSAKPRGNDDCRRAGCHSCVYDAG